MTKFINKSLLTLFVTSLVVSGCSKAFDDPTLRNDDLSGLATIKVFNAAMGTQRNNIFIDGVRQMRTAFAYGTTSPSHSGDLGFALTPGVRSFIIRDTLTTSTQPVLNFSIDARAGKSYSVFMYDTIATTKQIFVENDYTVPSGGQSSYRFANFVYSKTMLEPVKLISKSLGGEVFSSVPVTGVTAYTNVQGGVSDSLFIHNAVTNQLLTSFTFTPTPGRVYTLVYRGSFAITAPTNAAARTVTAMNDF